MTDGTHEDIEQEDKSKNVFIKMFIPKNYEKDSNAQIVISQVSGKEIPYGFMRYLIESSYKQRITMFDGLICGNWIELEVKPILGQASWFPEFVNYIILSEKDGDSNG